MAKLTPERERLLRELARTSGYTFEQVLARQQDLGLTKHTDVDPLFMNVVLSVDSVRQGELGGPVKGARASIEAGTDAGSRVTATRMVAVGLLAFALKKRTGYLYLTIEHPDYFLHVAFPASREREARSFAALVNQRARS